MPDEVGKENHQQMLDVINAVKYSYYLTIQELYHKLSCYVALPNLPDELYQNSPARVLAGPGSCLSCLVST